MVTQGSASLVIIDCSETVNNEAAVVGWLNKKKKSSIKRVVRPAHRRGNNRESIVLQTEWPDGLIFFGIKSLIRVI